jgi:hypothetical protein
MHPLLLLPSVLSAGGDRPFLISGADDRLIKVRRIAGCLDCTDNAAIFSTHMSRWGPRHHG